MENSFIIYIFKNSQILIPLYDIITPKLGQKGPKFIGLAFIIFINTPWIHQWIQYIFSSFRGFYIFSNTFIWHVNYISIWEDTSNLLGHTIRQWTPVSPAQISKTPPNILFIANKSVVFVCQSS